jgi:hypothetical protein
MSSRIAGVFILPLTGVVVPRVAAAARVAWLVGLALAGLLLTSIDKSHACSEHHGVAMHISFNHRSTPSSASSAPGVVIMAITRDTAPCIAGTCSHRGSCWYCACCATYSIAVAPKNAAEFIPGPRSMGAASPQRDVASFATSPEVPPPIPFA